MTERDYAANVALRNEGYIGNLDKLTIQAREFLVAYHKQDNAIANYIKDIEKVVGDKTPLQLFHFFSRSEKGLDKYRQIIDKIISYLKEIIKIVDYLNQENEEFLKMMYKLLEELHDKKEADEAKGFFKRHKRHIEATCKKQREYFKKIKDFTSEDQFERNFAKNLLTGGNPHKKTIVKKLNSIFKQEDEFELHCSEFFSHAFKTIKAINDKENKEFRKQMLKNRAR